MSAFVDPKQTQRLNVPDEPGQWVELRPLTARDLANIQREAQDMIAMEAGLVIIRTALVAWSYDRPVDNESIDSLNRKMMTWLLEQVDMDGGAEKKDSSDSSTSGPLPSANGVSLVSSGI